MDTKMSGNLYLPLTLYNHRSGLTPLEFRQPCHCFMQSDIGQNTGKLCVSQRLHNGMTSTVTQCHSTAVHEIFPFRVFPRRRRHAIP